MKINIQNFPNYESYPRNGETNYSDSEVFEIEFEKDSIEYVVLVKIYIDYLRYYSEETSSEPEEDDFSIENLEISIQKAWTEEDFVECKYISELEDYIKNNLKIE